MARQREVGTLWTGGPLGWLEEMCLRSFVGQGQRTTLFSYRDIASVPKGVILRDGREIVGDADFGGFERSGELALFRDWFRIRMVAKCPAMIWIEPDVYCRKPMQYDGDYVLGYAASGQDEVGVSVLGLPVQSPILAELLDFLSDPHAIPPFLSGVALKNCEASAVAGNPAHVRELPQGVWGRQMMTHFVKRHGLSGRVQPADAFHPVAPDAAALFLRPLREVEAMLTDRTTALHLGGPELRAALRASGGMPPEGSWLDTLLRRHRVRPRPEPARTPLDDVPVARLLSALPAGHRIRTFADLGGRAGPLAQAAHQRDGSDIVLIDVDAEGAFHARESDGVAACRRSLAKAGIPAGKVRVVRKAADLPRVDVLCNLAGAGHLMPAARLAPFLSACLGPEGWLITDIRQGSGGFPFLNRRGACEVLAERADGTATYVRALFRPARPDGSRPRPAAARTAALAGPGGFHTVGGPHSCLFVPRGGDVLVVSFDTPGAHQGWQREIRPWGHHTAERQGWSMLGVMADGWTWYRDPWVIGEFERLAKAGFFDRFGRVVFHGAEMGGYAACAFSAFCPGAEVVAITPVSTLATDLVPWETRYGTAAGLDFSGTCGDAATSVAGAGRVSLIYDPCEPLDAGHAARFAGANVVHLCTPRLGRSVGLALYRMGILNPVIVGALAGELRATDFHRMFRARHAFPPYQRALFEQALDRGRPDLARRVGHWVLSQGPHRVIQRKMQDL